MTMKNNYGSWIDSEVPSPGVVSFNKVQHEWPDDGICVDCEKIFSDIDDEIESLQFELDEMKKGESEEPSTPENIQQLEDEIEELENSKENVECLDHEFIYGDWKKNEDGKYIPDETGEFAAILTQGGFNDITVVWSKFTTRGTPCSPCAPSCVSIPDDEETGEFLCYTLPKYLLEEE